MSHPAWPDGAAASVAATTWAAAVASPLATNGTARARAASIALGVARSGSMDCPKSSRPDLEAGEPLAEFLEDFPTVSREQAIAALEQAKDVSRTSRIASGDGGGAGAGRRAWSRVIAGRKHRRGR